METYPTRPESSPNHCRDCGTELVDRPADGRRQCKLCRNSYHRRRDAAIKAGTWVPRSETKKSYIRKGVPRPTGVATEVDLHWAAGFLEGEGSFRLCGTSPEVSAPQKDPECLLRLQRLFGGHLRKRKNKDIHEWNVYGILARDVMNALYPLLSQRRQAQIREALGAVRQVTAS